MTDPVAVALIAGIPLTLGAIGQLWVIIRTKRTGEQVDKIERQTNSMNSEMVASARKEGRQEGKERAEGVAAVAAASVAAVTATPALPIIIAPASSDPTIAKWIQMGVDLEKARRDAAGNGPR